MINRLPLDFRLPNGAKAARTVAAEPSRIRSAAERAFHQAAQCIACYPVASLATAFLSGLVFGRLIKGK